MNNQESRCVRSVLEFLYRRALVLYPREFRVKYGQQMLQVFRDTSLEARIRHGQCGALLVGIMMLVELLVCAPIERLVRHSPPHTPSRHTGRRCAACGFLKQDLKYAFRRLAKSPGFSTVAILTLAIGIGANTAIFSIVNAVLIRNRPYKAPHELVHIYSNVEGKYPYANSSFLDLQDLRAADDMFGAVGAYSGRLARATENDESRPVFVEAVTQNLFPLLGIETSLGRTFLPEEDVVPGSHPVVILGHSYWQRRYGGAPDVLGKTLALTGTPYTIVGVMPASLESLMLPGVRTDLFVPMTMAAHLSPEVDEGMYADRGALEIKIIGRLQSGVSVDQASARIDGLSRQLRLAYPEGFGNRVMHLVPTLDVVIQPDFDAALLVPVAALLMTMVGLVLLLTCTNLASLLVARGIDREKEFAVRLALGAHRSRLVSQLLSETMLLCLIGSAVGLLLARWTLDILTAVQPPFWVPIAINHELDHTVLLFTLTITAVAGLLSGVAPAVRGTKTNVAPTLKGESTFRRERGFNLRSVLVAVQIAVSTVLLVSGGLFLRSLQEARDADPGFTTRDAGVIWLDLAVSGIPESEWSVRTQELTERALALPGIDVVGASNGIPLAVGAWSDAYDIPGVEPPAGADNHRVRFLSIDQHFFETMGVSLASGRGIKDTDRASSEPVMVVSEAAARRFWPEQDPLGKVVASVTTAQTIRVVGVARDIKLDRLDEAPQPLFYLSQQQQLRRADNVLLVARGSATPDQIATDLRRVVREVDRNLVVMTVSTLEEQFAAMLFPFRAAAGMLGAFGILALALSAVGIYGAVSFSVSRRTREVGIRMSLGADTVAVIQMMVTGVLSVVVVGMTVGLAAAFGIAQFLRNFLIGVEPNDLITLVSVPVLLFCIALVAALVPARSASSVTPVNALRHE